MLEFQNQPEIFSVQAQSGRTRLEYQNSLSKLCYKLCRVTEFAVSAVRVCRITRYSALANLVTILRAYSFYESQVPSLLELASLLFATRDSLFGRSLISALSRKFGIGNSERVWVSLATRSSALGTSYVFHPPSRIFRVPTGDCAAIGRVLPPLRPFPSVLPVS